MAHRNFRCLLYTFIMSLLIPSIAGCERQFKETKFLMNTVVDITTVGNEQDCQKAMKLAFDEIERIDKLMNVYDRSSEVSRINQMAGKAAVKVSKETLEVITQAIRFARLTDGAMDITISPLMDLWGFRDDNKKIPSEGEIKARLPLLDYRKVMVNEADSTVKLTSLGMQIDLGAITPGYAVDRAIQVLKNAGIQNALVNAGGEIYSIGSPPKRKAWRIGIRHPRKPGELLGVVEMSEKGVSTSGDYENFFEVDGRKYCHIIDPKTGRPVEGIMSVTVIAKNTTEADALSTALFPLGAEKGLKLIESLDGVDVIIVTGYNEGDMKVLMSSGIKDKVKLRIK